MRLPLGLVFGRYQTCGLSVRVRGCPWAVRSRTVAGLLWVRDWTFFLAVRDWTFRKRRSVAILVSRLALFATYRGLGVKEREQTGVYRCEVKPGARPRC